MTWHKYDLVFRLLAPMHIGHRKSSNLMQTRGYVTGKVFWASLTARLTRDFDNGADGQRYQEIGQMVQETFRFEYFYPALSQDDGYQVYYPWQDDFEYLFLESYTSSALSYDNLSAADGLLHETELIAPHTRCGQPVYLCGAVYVQDQPAAPLDRWQDALDKLQFGGERGYGWGRVELIKAQSTGWVEQPLGKVIDSHITAHLVADVATNISGPVEPLIGWERNNQDNRDTKRWRLTPLPQICYAPGSQISAHSSSQHSTSHHSTSHHSTSQHSTFQIGRDGIWHLATTD